MKRCLECDQLFASDVWVCPACGFTPEIVDGIYSFASEISGAPSDYDPGSYERIRRVQSEHFWFRGRNELICSQLRRYFPTMESLLEIGCGTGQVLMALHQSFPMLSLYGTEVHTQGLAYAREGLRGANFLQMDARKIPYSEEFDMVTAFDVVEHIEDDVLVLKQMYAACKPGGGVLLTVPQHKWLWSYKDELACHKRRYTRHELVEKVVEAGFQVVTVTSFLSLLVPLMYAARSRYKTSTVSNPEREFEISSWVNSIFLAISRVENLIIRLGVSLPVGGSLILVGRKPNHAK